MAFSEKQIQTYIWEHRDTIFSRIVTPDFTEPHNIKVFSSEPWEVLYKMLMTEYELWYILLKDMNLFGCEVSLPKMNESTIRADFLGCFTGENGLIVCELKVNKDPERQAYTELPAYATHIRGAFSPMGRNDIVYLLISPMEERITREATINTLLYDKNRTIVLTPEVGDDIDSLKFHLWLPSKRDLKVLSKSAFAYDNIDTFKVCWRGEPGIWSPVDKGLNPDDQMVHQLNQVSAYAAQLMEEKGINGFVFCSQCYPEVRDAGFLENSITICGINPYKSAKTRLLYEKGLNLKEAAQQEVSDYSIINIFPSLGNRCKDANSECNYWEWMSQSWSSCLDRIAFDVIDVVTKNYKGSTPERGYGGFTWEQYLFNSGEDRSCWNYDIHLTGMIRELYVSYYQMLYDEIKKCDDEEVKEYIMSEYFIDENFIDMLNSQVAIRTFIYKMVSESEDDEIEDPSFDDIIFHDDPGADTYLQEEAVKKYIEEGPTLRTLPESGEK